MSIRVILISTQKSFANTSARIWNAMQSEIEVNVSISKFQNVFKNVFARTYTSFQIFKIGHLYNVLCTDSLPHYD